MHFFCKKIWSIQKNVVILHAFSSEESRIASIAQLVEH